MSDLVYNDIVTFFKVASSTYRNKKIASDSGDVACSFIQGTGFTNQRFEEEPTADAVLYVDPDNDFVSKYAYRLEGMYVLANVFGGDDSESWYKVSQCVVNRDHLLSNNIDNIQCRLKKAAALPGVS